MQRRHRTLRIAWVAGLVVACTSPDGGIRPFDPDDADVLDDDDAVGDDDDADAFDCATVPDEPLSERLVDGPRGYHGLAIDGDGVMVGSDNSSLIRSTYDGGWSVFVPGTGAGQQIAYEASGDLVWNADDGAVERITPEGGRENLVSDRWSYGMKVAPDGSLWTAGSDRVTRTDPVTG